MIDQNQILWDERNSTELQTNCKNKSEQETSDITKDIKTSSTPNDWRSITDPRLKTNARAREWRNKNKHRLKDKTEKRIQTSCSNCCKIIYEKPSRYKSKKRHFCSRNCYSEFRKSIPFYEQPAYKGARKKDESKQVYHRNYVKKYPEVIAHLKARYRARKRNADGSHTLKEWQDLVVKFDNKCAFCKESKKLTKDHIIPLSKGGSDFIFNIQPLCKNCNSKKNNKI